MSGGTVAHHGSWGNESALRRYLLDDRVAFRHRMVSTLADDPAWSSQTWEQLSHSVDALASGGEYRCHGWELRDDHPARVLGVNTDLVLGADNVLRVV
jgi:hypothetical protein